MCHLLSTAQLVSKMKFLCLLLFICAVKSTLSINVSSLMTRQVPISLVSVTDTYSGLPICTGTFVSKDTVLTTATCLFCDQDCQMRVEISDPVKKVIVQYEVKSVILHEKYELGPSVNDIGLIKIKGEVPEYLIVKLHELNFEPTNYETFYFTAKFVNGHIIFQRNSTSLISNARCTHVLHKYIPQSIVCAYSKSKFRFHERDQGTPLMYENNGQYFLIGTQVTENAYFGAASRIATYQRIGPYIKWIYKNAKNQTHTSCSDAFVKKDVNFPPLQSLKTSISKISSVINNLPPSNLPHISISKAPPSIFSGVLPAQQKPQNLSPIQPNSSPNQINVSPNHPNVIPNQMNVSPNQPNASPNMINMPPNHSNQPSVHANSPIKQINIPPNHSNSPSIPVNSPPNQVNIPPNHSNSPSIPVNSPPKQINIPPNHSNSPSIPVNSPPKQINIPPNHSNSPSIHVNSPPKHSNVSPNQVNVSPNHPNASPNQVNVSPNHPNASPNQVNVSPNHSNASPNQPNASPNFKNSHSGIIPPPPNKYEQNRKNMGNAQNFNGPQNYKLNY